MSHRSLARRSVLLKTLAGGGYVLGLAQAAATATRDETDTAEVTSMITKYARSVDAAGREAGFGHLGQHSGRLIHPPVGPRAWLGGCQVERLREADGETFSERKLSGKDVVVHAYRDAAWAEFYWEFIAKF